MTRRELLGQVTTTAAAAGLTALAPLRELLHREPRRTAGGMPSLDNARRAERWIARSRIATPSGVTWPANPLQPSVVDRTLYNGTPGIVLFLLELHHATGDAGILKEAALGADDLIAHLEEVPDPGLYTGVSGIAHVIGETARATEGARYRAAAAAALRRVKDMPAPESTDIISGSAGIGLYLLHHNEVDAATRHADRLLALGHAEHGGLKWAITPSIRNLYPNFSHGTAGVAYFLATLFEKTGQERYLEAALAGHRYLEAVAIKGSRDEARPRSLRVFHHEPGGEDLFYLSWCHGPAGTARLYQRLTSATGLRLHADRVHQYARAILDAGVPERRSPGYWNNISQCCGDAGVGEFFIVLQRAAPRQEYADMVERIERHLLSRATPEGDTLKWVQAEHRVRPELLIAQTGYMQGAAGVGTFFLHADAMRSGRDTFIRFPDAPSDIR